MINLLIYYENKKIFISEIKPIEFLLKPKDCFDKLILNKLEGILRYSKNINYLSDPIILTIKNDIIVFDYIENYLERIKNGTQIKFEKF